MPGKKPRYAKPKTATGGRNAPPAGGRTDRPEVDTETLQQDFSLLLESLGRQHVELTEEAISGLKAYGELLVERSKVLNLVGQADRPRIFSRHIAECLAAPLLERAARSLRLVDIGAGGGLPGIPIALCCPSLKVTLVEPRLRKAQFLESAVSALGLAPRVTVFHGSADSFSREGVAPEADLATARAVDRLPTLWGWGQQILAPGGWLVAFKGPGEVEDELALIEGPGPGRVELFTFPDRPRVVVFLQRG